MAELTIVTINCLGLPVPLPGLRRRLSALGTALASLDADVACLQEVGQWRHLPLLRHDEERWPHALSILHPYAPKGGLVILSRLPVSDPAYFPFQERGGVISLHATERHQAKGVLRTTVAVAGRSFIVLNTHLAANYNAQWSYTNPYAKVERAQLRELATFVGAVPEATPVIVAGDFNVPRGSWLYHEFRVAAKVIDPLEQATAPTYRPLPGMPVRAAQALDHILLRLPEDGTFNVESELCFGEPVLLGRGGTPGYLSDHLGVKLRLQWPATESDKQIGQATG